MRRSTAISLDIGTLLVMTAAVTALTGALLLFAWLSNRDEGALALWGGGCVVMGAGIVLVASLDVLPGVGRFGIGNAVLVAGYAMVWAGARRFDDRSVPVPALVAGPLAWLAFCGLPGVGADVGARLAVGALFGAVFFSLAAFDLWRGRAERLSSRLPAVVLLAAHAAALLGRAALQIAAPTVPTLSTAGPLTALSLFEGTLVVVAASFLLLTMSKERAEAFARHAATHDPLTGLGNRRAFLAAAERARAACLRDNAPLSLVFIDLERFKSINDLYGHPMGDRVLRGFADTVAPLLRPGDLFARLGGDEFALLLPGLDAEAAAALTDRLRPAVAAAVVGEASMGLGLSLSAGVAALPPLTSIDVLLAEADRALYLAKDSGRDKVVHKAVTRAVAHGR